MTLKLNGCNQSLARKLNNELVIKMLRKNDYSATELANKLKLSNAAMSSIVKGLETKGLIKISSSLSLCGKGRKQVIYSLNEKYGLIIIVSLSDNRYKVTISNIKEEILEEVEKEISKYDVATIYELILKIKDILSINTYWNIPLRSIIIAVPGKVDSSTGELLLSKQFESDLFDGTNSIQSLFKKHFDIPVTIYNDINLALIGEMRSGALTEAKNAFLFYLSNGLGGAFLFNGAFYGGENGVAGEFGLLNASFNGEDKYLDEFVSLRAIKEYLGKKNNQTYHVDDLVALYEKKGYEYSYINETAHLVGQKLRAVVDLLNISLIIISGRVVNFKDEYLSILQEEVNKSNNKCTVAYSTLGKNNILLGAISSCVDSVLNTYIEEK